MTNFPSIYIISLSRTPERRLNMQRQLDTFGLEYEFVDVDDIDKYELESRAYRIRIAQSLDIDECLLENKYAAVINHAKTKKNKNWQNDNLGQLATMLSHIKIYDLMVKNDIEWACILEDDATLLPTFPEVLKIAPKLEWDILLLASRHSNSSLEKHLAQTRLKTLSLLKKLIRYSLFLGSRLNKSDDPEQRTYAVKKPLELYDVNPHLYPRQAERIAQIYEEYDMKYKEIIKTLMQGKPHLFLIKREREIRYKKHRKLHGCLVSYSSIQFGAFPEKNSLESINEHHRIAKPKYCPILAAAYLVNQKAAMKWKRRSLAPNILAIDQIPWELYKNEQVKLRIVTPPCATATYAYLVHSVRCR